MGTAAQFELEEGFCEPNPNAKATFAPQFLPSASAGASSANRIPPSQRSAAASAPPVVPVPLFFPHTSSILKGFWGLGVIGNSTDAFYPTSGIPPQSWLSGAHGSGVFVLVL